MISWNRITGVFVKMSSCLEEGAVLKPVVVKSTEAWKCAGREYYQLSGRMTDGLRRKTNYGLF